MDSDDFLREVVAELTHELRPNDAIKRFTANPTIIGQYAEESVRKLVRKTIAPLRVSTGAVVDPVTVPDDKLPQIDTIVWTPSPAPALFEAGDFGLIPRGSSMGILEIKRSDYRGVSRSLTQRLTPKLVRTLVADPMLGEGGKFERLPALGVVCIREHTNKDKNSKLDRLVQQGRVVVLFERVGKDLRERPKDVCDLINFLAYLRSRARHHDGAWRITYRGQ
jgi:hypothetical protein